MRLPDMGVFWKAKARMWRRKWGAKKLKVPYMEDELRAGVLRGYPGDSVVAEDQVQSSVVAGDKVQSFVVSKVVLKSSSMSIAFDIRF